MNDAITAVNAPWLLWILAGSTVAYTVARQAAESYSAVAQLLGPLGRRWQQARQRRHTDATKLADLETKIIEQDRELAVMRDRLASDAWTADLRRQIAALDEAVTGLRRRDQIVDAFLVYDEEWHRRDLLGRGNDSYEPAPHKSYLEFEADWLAAKRNRRSTDPK